MAIHNIPPRPSWFSRVINRLNPFAVNRPTFLPPYPTLTVSRLNSEFNFLKLVDVSSRLAKEANGADFFRPVLTEGTPGALLRLNSDSRKTVAVGDLHGNKERLDELLKELTPRLAAGDINLVFLGDLIHPETGSQVRSMESSLEVLNAVVMLKWHYPDRVHCLPGNHDVVLSGPANRSEYEQAIDLVSKFGTQRSTEALAVEMADKKMIDEGMMVLKFDGKSPVPVPQVFEFLRYLIGKLKNDGWDSRRIAGMIMEYQRFFDLSPLSALVEGRQGAAYLAHSAIIRTGLKKDEELINARSNGLKKQLQWNAIASSRMAMRYSAGDVAATLTGLAVILRRPAKQIYIIAGHDPDPNRSVWAYQPFPNFVNYTIIHSNIGRSFGFMELSKGVPKREDRVSTAKAA